MSRVYELFITKNTITAEDFAGFYNALASYVGILKKVRFHVILKDNHIRYFVECDKDVGSVTSSASFAVLQPVSEEEVALPKHVKRERLITFVPNGNLLSLQEKISVKRSKALEHFICDARRVNFEFTQVKLLMYFRDAGGQYSLAKKQNTKFPANLFAVNFEDANNFMKSEAPKYLNIEKILHTILPDNMNALLEVSTYPYFPKPYYLPLSAYEFDKHSLIVGASGSGKSKFIELFLDRLNRLPNGFNYRAIVIDPHANLAADLSKIEGSRIFDFNGENTELFAGAEADITAATELTNTLMKSLMGDSYNARVERVLRFSLYILFSSQSMSLGMLKRFLTELELRQQILNHVDGHVPQNITHFFATDFNEIRTAYYNEALLPIISLVDELELQPAMLAEGGISLQQTINSNFLTVFSLNKVSMGDKVVKTVAGLLIQQIFLLAQSHAFNERVLLFIDEVSVVQNPALASILSEARKFNLFVILTQQYLSQVDKDLRDSIFANVSNYYCFRVSEEDAAQLVGNLPMELPHEMLEEAKSKGLKEETIKVRMLTDLHPRECIVRMAAGGLLLPCFKAKTLDISHDVVETSLGNEYKPVAYKGAPVQLEKFHENTEAVTYDDLPPDIAKIVQKNDKPSAETQAPPSKSKKASKGVKPIARFVTQLTAGDPPIPRSPSFQTMPEQAMPLPTKSSEPPPGFESMPVTRGIGVIQQSGAPPPKTPTLDEIMNQQSTKTSANGKENQL